MSEPIIINGIAKLRGKDAEWEFHRVLTPVGFKWYGRKSGDDKPVTRLTGNKLKAAEATYVTYLEQHQGVPPPPVSVEEEPEFDAGPEEPLHDDITTDSIIEPIMYREDVLGPKPGYRTLQRVHVGDSRYYVQQFRDDEGNWSRPGLYSGVTSVVGAVLPKSEHLFEHYASFPSYKDAKRALFLASAKGTIFHSLAAECLEGKLPDFGTNEMERHLRGHIHRQGIDPDEVLHEWTTFFYKAILGLKQFVYDYNVEVLAIEIVLGTPHQYFEYNGQERVLYGYFAQLDLVCHLDVMVDGKDEENKYKTGPRAGQPRDIKVPKRVLAIVDFKTGQSDNEAHDMQLLLQEPLVRAAFPGLDTSDIRLFNWHPTDFRMSSIAKKATGENAKEPEFGYSLLEKANNDFTRGWAQDHLRIWQKYKAHKLPQKAIYQGSANIDVRPAENIRFVEQEVYWEEKIERSRTHNFAKL